MITLQDWVLIRMLAAEGALNTRIAERLGISRTTVIEAVNSDAPPGYDRKPRATSFTVVEAGVRAKLAVTPDMPATVVERVGWEGSIRWFSENVKQLRPQHRPVDPPIAWSERRRCRAVRCGSRRRRSQQVPRQRTATSSR